MGTLSTTVSGAIDRKGLPRSDRTVSRIAFVSKKSSMFHLVVDSKNAPELFAAHLIRTNTGPDDYDVFSSCSKKEICSHALNILQEYRKANLVNGNLTMRQVGISDLVADGLTNKEIAEKARISVFTVKHHLREIFRILGMKNRQELLMFMKGGRHEIS